MPTRAAIVTGLTGGLVALTLGGSLLAVFAIAAPDSGPAGASGLTSVHEARANAALLNGAPDLARAEVETRKALGQSVAAPTSWLRLAYIEHQKAGGFSPAVALAVRRSYDAAPYGPDDTPWRLTFLFDNWQAAGPELRKMALDELRLAKAHGGYALRGLPDSISDPDGRLAATLALGRYPNAKPANR